MPIHKSVSSPGITTEDGAQGFYKEYPKVLRLPGVLFGHLDRGRRLPSTPLIEIAAPDVVEQLDSETDQAIQAAGELLDRKLIRFLIAGRKGSRIAARLCAIGIMARSIAPKDVPKLFDPSEVTPSRLRLATAELREILASDEKKTAAVDAEAASEKSNATVYEARTSDE